MGLLDDAFREVLQFVGALFVDEFSLKEGEGESRRRERKKVSEWGRHILHTTHTTPYTQQQRETHTDTYRHIQQQQQQQQQETVSRPALTRFFTGFGAGNMSTRHCSKGISSVLRQCPHCCSHSYGGPSACTHTAASSSVTPALRHILSGGRGGVLGLHRALGHTKAAVPLNHRYNHAVGDESGAMGRKVHKKSETDRNRVCSLNCVKSKCHVCAKDCVMYSC